MRAIIGSMLLLTATGCAEANASNVDSENDVHCYALSTYFFVKAVQRSEAAGSISTGTLSNIVVNQWYKQKVSAQLEASPPISMHPNVVSIRSKMGDDFKASKSTYTQCVRRYQNADGAEEFSRRFLTQMESAEFRTNLRA